MSDSSGQSLQRVELTTTLSLAAIFALRMFGLFMILPVFAVFGTELSGASPLLIGTAIGIYGLMQALLQIPFGLLSDRFGRRPLLLVGLLLFVIGGVVAALSEHIYGVIAGRALQGAGAIASVIMALIGDVVNERHRTRAMALVGMSVGLSFVLALILGPLLVRWLGLSGLFWLTSLLGVGAFLVAALLPTPKVVSEPLPLRLRFARVLGNRTLWRLDLGILLLHMVMTAMFVVVPSLLSERLDLAMERHSLLYLGVLVGGFVAMVPLIIRAERRGAVPVKRFAVVLLAMSMVLLGLAAEQLWHYVLALLLFFAAFNLLEALLPSMVSRAAPAGTRGAAMGVYSTHQFMGVFIGGQLGGALYHWQGAAAVFYGCAGLLLLWLLVLRGMVELPKLENRVLPLPPGVQPMRLAARLLSLPGVIEAVVVEERAVALLKVDAQRFNEDDVAALAGPLQT